MKKEEKEIKEEIKEEKKCSKKSKVITIMLCISFFCVFSILLFVIFGKECLPFTTTYDGQPQEKKEDNKTISVPKLEQMELSEKNIEINLNGKIIKLRKASKDNEILYLNDVEVSDKYISGIYVTNDYILPYEYGQCYYSIDSYIDSTGELKKLTKEDDIQFERLDLEDGKVYAQAEHCPCLDDGQCAIGYRVEFVYQNNTLSLKKIG